MTAILAQAVSSAFLMDPVKPVLTLAVGGAGAVLTSRLAKDIKFCGLPSGPWHAKMIAGCVAGLLAAVLIPCPFGPGFMALLWFYVVNLPLQVALTAAPFLLYWPRRNDAVPEKLRFVMGGDRIRQFFAARRKVKSFAGSRLTLVDTKKQERKAPGKNDPALPVFQAAEAMVMGGIDRAASRVDVVVKSEGAAGAATVDGVRAKLEMPATETALAAIDFLKDVCGLDPKERRKRQVGTCTANTPDGSVKLTVTTAGSGAAVQMRLDFDLDKRMGRTLGDLGLAPVQMKLLEPMFDPKDRGGVILVAAAPGQGLTTSSLALLARHDAFTSAVKALERQQVHRVEGVDHVLWQPGTVDYHTQLQSIVRRNPDVVYVDDVTDPGTGKVIAAPTSSDVRFYVALPVDGVGAAVTEWFRAVGDVKMAAVPLKAVVTQRLVRKLCLACRVGYQPSPEQAKRLGVPAGKTVELFRAGGKVQVKGKVQDCPMCRGSGFSGQVGVFEVVPFDDEARAHLAKGDLKSAYNAARLKFRAPGIQDAALLRVREGVTSLEEVARVFAPAAKPAAKPAAAAPAGAKPTQSPKPKA